MAAMEVGAKLVFMGIPRRMGVVSEPENRRFYLFKNSRFGAWTVKVSGQYGILSKYICNVYT